MDLDGREDIWIHEITNLDTKIKTTTIKEVNENVEKEIIAFLGYDPDAYKEGGSLMTSALTENGETYRVSDDYAKPVVVTGERLNAFQSFDRWFYKTAKGSNDNEMTLKEGVPYMIAGATLPLGGASFAYSAATGAGLGVMSLEGAGLLFSIDDVTQNEEGTFLERSTSGSDIATKALQIAKFGVSTTNFVRGAFNLKQVISDGAKGLEIGINTVNMVSDLATVGDSGSGLLIDKDGE